MSCPVCGRATACRCYVAPSGEVQPNGKPQTAGLLDGVNARLDRLEAKTANLLRQEGVMDSLLGLVTDMVDVKHRLEQLEAQVLGLLRRTRRPGEKLPGRKR